MNVNRFVPLLLIGIVTAQSARVAEPKEESSDKPKAFIVCDNFSYLTKPDGSDTTGQGLVNCTIVNVGTNCWQDKAKHILDEAALKDEVRKAARKSGPLVYDLEYEYDFKLFLNLVKLSHEVVPGCVVGFYGHGLFPDPPRKGQKSEAAELAKAVDAFFPSMYTFDNNREKWKGKLTGLVQAAHQIAPGTPVYPYLWPKYHKGGAKTGMLSGDHWRFELDAARECGADGVVIWGATTNNTPPWWQETLKFIATKPMVEHSKAQKGKDVEDPLDDKKKHGD